MQNFVRLFLIATITLLALSANAAERTTYYVPNAQGSPIAAMDEQGNVIWRETYTPYGERQTKAAGNDARNAYAGKPEDVDTGLVYMGARWYDPETARFTGIDPQGFGEGNPQSFGRYVYANNSPNRYLDPNGESPVDVLFLAYDAAVFAGAVASGNSSAMASAGADLAASLVGMLSPVPGTGQAIKAAKAADKIADGKSGLRVIIGEKQARVDDYAARNGGYTISDYQKDKGISWNQGVNDQFMSEMKEAGAEFVDIGPDFDRRLANRIDPRNGRPPSNVYGTERKALEGYSKHTKAYTRSGKYSGKTRDM